MRKRRIFVGLAVIAVLAGVGLVGLQSRRADDAAVAALTADLTATADKIDRAIAESSDPPSRADLRRMVGLLHDADDLSKRMNEIAPKLRPRNIAAYQAAQERFLQSLHRLATRMESSRDDPGGPDR